jgi:hypothetical protein
VVVLSIFLILNFTFKVKIITNEMKFASTGLRQCYSVTTIPLPL